MHFLLRDTSVSRFNNSLIFTWAHFVKCLIKIITLYLSAKHIFLDKELIQEGGRRGLEEAHTHGAQAAWVWIPPTLFIGKNSKIARSTYEKPKIGGCESGWSRTKDDVIRTKTKVETHLIQYLLVIVKSWYIIEVIR